MPLKAIRLQTPADPFLNATFVSVTQQFNTTTSMGRLKLNMLLSFAQFERQIDSERIRDKIAASKKKGTWMGGNVPIGSDVKDRELIVREPEASTVRLIFRRYAELGSVSLLRVELDRLGIVSKRREGPGGHLAAGQPFLPRRPLPDAASASGGSSILTQGRGRAMAKADLAQNRVHHPLCDLHSKIVRRGPRAGIQFSRRTAASVPAFGGRLS